MTLKRLFIWTLCGVAGLAALPLSAAPNDGEFVVRDIRIEGLQRISAGNVFVTLPVVVGQPINKVRIAEAIQALFATGQFDDIAISRDGSVLLVSVVERPSISGIEIKGNKQIKTEDLRKNLTEQNISEGRVLRRDTLRELQQGLLHSYVSQGRYDATVEINVKEEDRNRVHIIIDIDEGTSAQVADIFFVGNKSYDDETLLSLFETSPTNWLSWARKDNRYSREKLRGDLENLRSFYLDNGYLKFSVDATQVSVSADRKSVFISLNIDEGEIYEFSDVRLVGDLPVDEKLLQPVIYAVSGNTFSQAALTASEESITQILNNNGFTFAEVKAVPRPDEEGNKVAISMVVKPGRRYYARRITFSGNKRTNDEVLRRELRQLEGTWASSAQIDVSKVRLQRLGIFRNVEADTVEVTEASDQIDVNFEVEEEFTSSIGGGFGYNSYGFSFNANYIQKNYRGSGNSLQLSANASDYVKGFNFSMVNPYFTLDGTSLGFNVFYSTVDYGEFQVAEYLINRAGFGVNFRYPIDEIQSVGLSLGYDTTELEMGSLPAWEILDFAQQEGLKFASMTLTASWSKVTLDRGLFPRRGVSNNFNLALTVPGSELEYYRIDHNYNYYTPMGNSNWIFALRSQIGYVGGYGKTKRPPFFQHYYTGGIGSVRGFEINSLGPRGSAIPFIVNKQGGWLLAYQAGGAVAQYYKDAAGKDHLQYIRATTAGGDVKVGDIVYNSVEHVPSDTNTKADYVGADGKSYDYLDANLALVKVSKNSKVPLLDVVTHIYARNSNGTPPTFTGADYPQSIQGKPIYESSIAPQFTQRVIGEDKDGNTVNITLDGKTPNTCVTTTDNPCTYSLITDSSGNPMINTHTLNIAGSEVMLDYMIGAGQHRDGAIRTDVAAINNQSRREPLGGDLLTLGGLDFIFPIPGIKEQGSMRGAIFVDVGNVFSRHCEKYNSSFEVVVDPVAKSLHDATPIDDRTGIATGVRTTAREAQPACSDFKFGELRYSIGLGFSWITGFGPLTFSLAQPFNKGPYDKEEKFQFTLGRTF